MRGALAATVRDLEAQGVTVNRGAVTYVIHAEGTDFVKIGKTTDLAYRLSQLQTACPFPLRLLATYSDAGTLEGRLHDHFQERHHMREWFRVMASERSFIQRGGDPFTLKFGVSSVAAHNSLDGPS